MGISSQGRTLKVKKNWDKTVLIDTSCTECTMGFTEKNFSKPVSKVKGKRKLNTSIKCRQEWQEIVVELVQTKAVARSSDNWVASVDQKSQHT